MNTFGNDNGFKKIVERVMKGPINVNLLFGYLDIMSGPSNLYHRKFVIEYIAPFVEGVIKYMSAIPDEQLRNVSREKLDLALNQMDLLMRRVYTAKTKGEQSIRLKVGIALSLFMSEQLERRIQAIRLIAETCKSAKEAQLASHDSTLPTANDNIVLGKLLQVPQVIEEIFGKRSHIQLIQRSTEILKFFLLNSNITKNDFGVIWECCEHDEQSKIEIYKVLTESSALLSSELIGFITEKFAGVKKNTFKDQDVSLICGLVGKNSRPTFSLLKEIVEILWLILKEDNPSLSNEVYSNAHERFCDIITTPNIFPAENMRNYFSQAYDMLEKVSSFL